MNDAAACFESGQKVATFSAADADGMNLQDEDFLGGRAAATRRAASQFFFAAIRADKFSKRLGFWAQFSDVTYLVAKF